MKKVLCFVLALVLLLSLVGCGIKQGEPVTKSPTRFVIVSGESDSSCEYNSFIFVDQETGVLYLAMENVYRFAVTPLLNADGTPMTVSEFKANK